MELLESDGARPGQVRYWARYSPGARASHSSVECPDLHVSKDELGLIVEDKEGFSAVVGNADLVTPRTGETHQTSAASVVLFDKDKKVIWSAP